MSRNGSGTYTLPAGNPVVSGTTITSSWANTTMQNIADGLTQSVASDGQTPMSGALNMANNKIISVTDPTNAQDAATKAYTDAAITTASASYLAKASNLSDVANATTSRTNLSAAKSGANSDITSITGLTTALTVAQGGTGASTLTANNVLLGNGTSAPQFVAPSTSGNVLTSNGTTWVSSANNGTAKAWVKYNGIAQTIFGSYNVSSVTYLSTGRYQVNFTTAFSSANYAACVTASVDGTINVDGAFKFGVVEQASTYLAGSCVIGTSVAGAAANTGIISAIFVG